MSQKTNPTSLRLQKSNKHFSSSWYSDYFYNEMSSHDLRVRLYIEDVVNQISNSQPIFYIQNEYKKFLIYLFLHDPRGIRSQRGETLRVSGIRTPLPEAGIKKALSRSRAERQVNKLEKRMLDNTVQNPRRESAYKNEIKVNKENKGKVSVTFSHFSKILLSLVSSHSALGARARKRQIQQDNFAWPLSKMHLSLELFFDKLMQTDKVKSFFLTGDIIKLDTSSAIFRKKDETLKSVFAPSGTATIFCNNIKLLEMALMNTSKVWTTAFAPFSVGKGVSMKRNTEFSSTLFSESLLSNTNYVSLYPIRVIQDMQNAHFLISEIISLLQKRVPFRQIKDQIFREILKKESAFAPSEKPTLSLSVGKGSERARHEGALCNLISSDKRSSDIKAVGYSQIIKGIRISCSGRFAGRSKKAQKTKTQSVRWGETCLHVFASKLSFASKSTNTPFGKVGIKVWICFK